jgi:hypothetical protein
MIKSTASGDGVTSPGSLSVSRRRRPRAVSFVASLLLFEALLVVLMGAVVLGVRIASLPMPSSRPDDLFGPIVDALPGLGGAVVIITAGGGLLLAGIGLLRMSEWAWVLAMALQGFGLANALYAHFHGQPQYLTLALGSFVVLVLNQREVRQAFNYRHRHG